MKSGGIRAVDSVVEWLRLRLVADDSGGSGDATSARADVDGAIWVVGEDIFSINKTSLVNRNDRGKKGELDEEPESFADVLADSGRGAT